MCRLSRTHDTSPSTPWRDVGSRRRPRAAARIIIKIGGRIPVVLGNNVTQTSIVTPSMLNTDLTQCSDNCLPSRPVQIRVHSAGAGTASIAFVAHRSVPAETEFLLQYRTEGGEWVDSDNPHGP